MAVGVIVGGLLGRVMMRISGAMAGPAQVGVPTANGNLVGDITAQGTLELVVFAGLAPGVAGGALYGLVEPWLRPLGRWGGIAYGAALLGLVGVTVLEPTNFDFKRFGSAPLNVAMFVTLFLVFGVGVAWLFGRLSSLAARPGRAGQTLTGLALLALVPAAFALLVAVGAPGGATDPLVVIVALGLAAAVIVRWRGLPEPVGYAALLVPVAVGASRLIGGLPGLLSGL